MGWFWLCDFHEVTKTCWSGLRILQASVLTCMILPAFPRENGKKKRETKTQKSQMPVKTVTSGISDWSCILTLGCVRGDFTRKRAPEHGTNWEPLWKGSISQYWVLLMVNKVCFYTDLVYPQQRGLLLFIQVSMGSYGETDLHSCCVF